MDRIHYGDRFTLRTDVVATAEEWARAMFGDVPSAGELLIWRGVLGLRLRLSRSAETVGGWRIHDRNEDFIWLRAASWWLHANLLVRRSGTGVSLTTLLHYRRAWGRVAWPPLAAVHRHLVPGVLRSADAKLRAAR